MTAPAAPAPSTAPPESAGTDYVILAKDGATWKQHRTVTARSADQAIRDHLKTAGGTPVNADGTYLAIPSRSFKPVTVKTETVTTLKLEEAK